MKEAIDKIKSIKDDVRVPSDPIKKWLADFRVIKEYTEELERVEFELSEV